MTAEHCYRLPGDKPLCYRPRMKLPFANWFRRTSAAEKQLLTMCRGDKGQMERLINHEIARHPQWSRSKASEAAVDRWVRGR